MHKKLASDLTSLAHSILQMKNKDDVFALQQKAHELYEKLSVLAYIEEYINTTPNATETKKELIAKVESASDLQEKKPTKVVHVLDSVDEDEKIDTSSDEIVDKPIENTKNKEVKLDVISEITEQPFDEIEELIFPNDDVKNDVKDVGARKTPTLEEELKDTIAVDIAMDLFEKVPQKKSLNDQLQSNIEIGLNDRIAFVKHLFNGNQEDFNRVISQLNTIKTEKEAKKFISKMIKPDYNWTEKEEYEERLIKIIERKFS